MNHPEQQRRAIAEACPKLFYGHHGKWFLHSENPRNIYGAPNEVDVLNDLNAMHEAEKVLNEKQQVWYLQKLTQVRFKAGVSGMIGCMIDKTVFATAAQRAEAFLRTIGKWKE